MRLLVTWGSKRGGTAGIGRIIANALERRGYEVVAAPAHEVTSVEGFDGVVLGGALYAHCWPASARRFVDRHTRALRHVPVWFFSSGPLDDSASRHIIPATEQVAVLAERVGAQGHITFGGRLLPDAEGFVAGAMARENAGDWRNLERIEAWAGEIADALPCAAPGRGIDHAAFAPTRVVTHGLFGWAVSAALLALLFGHVSATTALALHAVATPLIFVAVSRHYFGARGSREALPTALAFATMSVLLDLLVMRGDLGVVVATLIPAALVFFASWATGALMATLPWPDVEEPDRGRERHA